MRNDKKSHMKRANQLFQERINLEDSPNKETKKVYHMPDIHPELSRIIK